MRPQTQVREVNSHGVAAKGTFGISETNQVHIMTILRDTLYTDRILAVLREYASNAWDAHREAGKGDLPIKVVLPTPEEPTLVIRDWGLGLSEEDVFEVYTQYGDSTKRDSDTCVGMLGIGCKSGFAYTETFTVTSWHGGWKKVYVAVLDESDVGEILKLSQEASGVLLNRFLSIMGVESDFDNDKFYPLDVLNIEGNEEESEVQRALFEEWSHEQNPGEDIEVGLEIQIAVSPRDIHDFHWKAKNLFRHFSPKPDINIDLPDYPRDLKKNGFFYRGTNGDSGWTAVMGCVPYRIDTRQIQEELKEEELLKTIGNLRGGLFFDIGEVQTNASREELKYNDQTKQAIIDKFQALFDEYVEDLLQVFREKDTTNWQRRLTTASTRHQLHLRVPKRFEDFSQQTVVLYGQENLTKESEDDVPTPEFFQAKRGSALSKSPPSRIRVHVSSNTRILFRDTILSLAGYDIQPADILVSPTYKITKTTSEKRAAQELARAKAELEQYLENAQLTGIPLQNLSDLSWVNPKKYRAQNYNPKHNVNCFRLKSREYEQDPPSSNWEIISREPQDDDVFVILHRFVAEDYDRFLSEFRSDLVLAKALGIEMPEVYGYKTTAKKPVAKEDCKGTHYKAWRTSFFPKEIQDNKEFLDLLEAHQWMVLEDSWAMRTLKENAAATADFLQKKLGGRHMITRMLRKHLKGQAAVAKASTSKRKVLNTLKCAQPFLEQRQNPATATLARIHKTYPLFSKGGPGLGVLAKRRHYREEDTSSYWIEYIKMVDSLPSFPKDGVEGAAPQNAQTKDSKP